MTSITSIFDKMTINNCHYLLLLVPVSCFPFVFPLEYYLIQGVYAFVD
jgi:hypothetical protein